MLRIVQQLFPKLRMILHQIHSLVLHVHSMATEYLLLTHSLQTHLIVSNITVHPLLFSLNSISPYLLSAFGTDGKFTAADVSSRWRHIHQEFKSKGVHIIGFSSDCDSRYLLAMEAALGFFAHFAFTDHPDLFSIDLPMT